MKTDRHRAADVARALNGAVTCLATAGTALIGMRGQVAPEAEPLVTAIRESIDDLIKDVEAVRDMAKG